MLCVANVYLICYHWATWCILFQSDIKIAGAKSGLINDEEYIRVGSLKLYIQRSELDKVACSLPGAFQEKSHIQRIKPHRTRHQDE